MSNNPNQFMPDTLAPVRDLDEKWQQMVHEGCGGELVIIVRRQTQVATCCKGCKLVWPAAGPPMPDWVPAKPVKTPGGLWLPGMPKGVM